MFPQAWLSSPPFPTCPLHFPRFLSPEYENSFSGLNSQQPAFQFSHLWSGPGAGALQDCARELNCAPVSLPLQGSDNPKNKFKNDKSMIISKSPYIKWKWRKGWCLHSGKSKGSTGLSLESWLNDVWHIYKKILIVLLKASWSNDTGTNKALHHSSHLCSKFAF